MYVGHTKTSQYKLKNVSSAAYNRRQTVRWLSYPMHTRQCFSTIYPVKGISHQIQTDQQLFSVTFLISFSLEQMHNKKLNITSIGLYV